MNSSEREILHHHAAAIDWLCRQLADLSPTTSDDDWRQAALRDALYQWENQPPEALAATLERNLNALQRAIADNHNEH